MSGVASTEYTVVEVIAARGPQSPTDDAVAPAEILERFEGRTFTLRELEQRGVRIAGGRAYYTSLGRDWALRLFPDLAASST
jgi:hypothetical protein